MNQNHPYVNTARPFPPVFSFIYRCGLILGICFLSQACSHEHDAHHQETSEHNHANSSDGVDAELSLNAGKPWEADASTNQGMRKLNDRLEHAEPGRGG